MDIKNKVEFNIFFFVYKKLKNFSRHNIKNTKELFFSFYHTKKIYFLYLKKLKKNFLHYYFLQTNKIQHTLYIKR